MDLRIGIDLGGTKIECVALDDSGAELARTRIATPEPFEDVIHGIGGAIDHLSATTGGSPVHVGVGIPAYVSPVTELVEHAKPSSLNGRDLRAELAAVLGLPVRVENDANCFVLAEAKAGAASGADLVLGVIVGTGVGAGIVWRGEVIGGRTRIAGELGHNPLPGASADELPGPRCHCGRDGCIEAWCAGPGLARDHKAVTGEVLAAPEIAARAANGNGAARATLSRHVDRLGRALGSAVNIIDPDVIVLGGGVSNMDHLYDELPDAIRPHVFADCFDTPVVRNRLGDSAGVIGAAWLKPLENAE